MFQKGVIKFDSKVKLFLGLSFTFITKNYRILLTYIYSFGMLYLNIKFNFFELHCSKQTELSGWMNICAWWRNVFVCDGEMYLCGGEMYCCFAYVITACI